MADFRKAFEVMIRNEGGYVSHTVKGDRGGQTYAGISRKAFPGWPGWFIIDNGGQLSLLREMVAQFYSDNFWTCNDVDSDDVATSLFDFSVNAGKRTAVKLAQIVTGVEPDGVIGPKTVAAINAMDTELFVLRFTLAKVARYNAIVAKDRSQLKFLHGWLNRALK